MAKDKTQKGKGKKYGGVRSYDFTKEADKALEHLKKELGRSRTQLVNEAVIQMALANGVEIKGQKSKATLTSLEKKTANLEEAVRALCRIAVAYECGGANYETKADKAIGEAIDPESHESVEALLDDIKRKLPKCLRGEDVFRIYFTGEWGLDVDEVEQ